MTDCTKLIKALLYCGNFVDRDGCDEECPYFNDKDCPKRIMCDAADALEAADAKIVKLNTKCADLQSQINEMENEIEELLPKEGEWIPLGDAELRPYPFVCSACKRFAITDEEYKNWHYCPNCGARMETVTDCHTLEEREQ